MTDIVNLRRARKRKERADASAKADANRLTFGRTKHEKALTDAQRQRSERHVDSHKREPDE